MFTCQAFVCWRGCCWNGPYLYHEKTDPTLDSTMPHFWLQRQDGSTAITLRFQSYLEFLESIHVFFNQEIMHAQNDECFIAIVCWVAMSGDITLSLDVLGIYQDVQIQHCYTCRSYYEAAATKMSMPLMGKVLHLVEIYEPSYAQLLDINLLARLPASNIPDIKVSDFTASPYIYRAKANLCWRMLLSITQHVGSARLASQNLSSWLGWSHDTCGDDPFFEENISLTTDDVTISKMFK